MLNLLLVIAFYGLIIVIPIIISILLRKLPSLSIALSIFTFLLGMYLYIPNADASIISSDFADAVDGIFFMYGSVILFVLGIGFLVYKKFKQKKQIT